MFHSSPKPKPLTLSLLGMALVIFSWMAWVAIRRGALARCGEGHSNVLGSHWAYLGPIHEPLIGAVIYLATLMVLLRGKAVPARIFSAIIIAAALFFLVIQAVVLRSFCPWDPNGNWLAYGELSITSSAFPQPTSCASVLARTCGLCRKLHPAPASPPSSRPPVQVKPTSQAILRFSRTDTGTLEIAGAQTVSGWPSQLAPRDEGELSAASKSNRFALEAGQSFYLISAKNIASPRSPGAMPPQSARPALSARIKDSFRDWMPSVCQNPETSISPSAPPFTRNLAPSGTTPTGSDSAGLHLA